MVIELSGVQFGLKSCAWFQNRTSAQREFDLISDQNCTALSSITALLNLFWNHTILWSQGLFTWMRGTSGRRGNPPSRGQIKARVYIKLTIPGSRGDDTRCCCVVARHVNRENGGRTTHFGGQCSLLLIICSRCNVSVLWLFTVAFDDLARLQI